MTTRILIVEDDAALAGSMVRRLGREGYEIELCTCGDSGVARAMQWRPDLVLLDLMLPGQSGLDVLQRLSLAHLRTIVLTARVEVADRVRCFELGAIDYVPKPFFMDEILARIRTRLAPVSESPRRLVQFRGAVVDLDARSVILNGKPVVLTRFEFDLLAYLVERPGRAVSRSQIQVQGLPSSDPTTARTIDTHVVRLRRKLEDAGRAIVTVWGVGYRFDKEQP